MFRRIIERTREALRERHVLTKCGCACRCPVCHDLLNDQAEVTAFQSGAVVYACSKCGYNSLWDFTTPTPTYLLRNDHGE